MALYILKWIVGIVVLAVGILFGLSIAMNTSSADFYQMSGATMIAVAFIIAGSNIFMMGASEKKKNKEIKKNKQILSKVEGLSTEKRMCYRNIK